MFVFGGAVFYALSPRIRLASWMSLGMMVTRQAVDGAQVSVLEQTDEIGLCCFLETQYSH